MTNDHRIHYDRSYVTEVEGQSVTLWGRDHEDWLTMQASAEIESHPVIARP